VELVESWVGVAVLPLAHDGAPNLNPSINPAGSVNGLYFNEDRATPVVGRMADPSRADEFVTTALGARALGWHVGQVVPMGVYSSNQFGLPGFGTPSVAPLRRIDMKLVGLVVFNNQVIEDDADRLPTDVLFTPALTRTAITSAAVQGTWYAMQLAHGDNGLSAIEEKLIHLLPSGSDANFTVTAITETKVERAVKPESIALGVFGAIAALAALAIGALAISRVLRSDEADLYVLRADRSPGRDCVRHAAGSRARDLALTAVPARTHPSRVPRVRDRGRLDGPGFRATRADWRARRHRGSAGLSGCPTPSGQQIPH
jgi:hypothetical protein